MSQARVTTTAVEVVVEAEASAHISSVVLELVHSVQTGVPAPPPSGRRWAVVIVMG